MPSCPSSGAVLYTALGGAYGNGEGTPRDDRRTTHGAGRGGHTGKCGSRHCRISFVHARFDQEPGSGSRARQVYSRTRQVYSPNCLGDLGRCRNNFRNSDRTTAQKITAPLLDAFGPRRSDVDDARAGILRELYSMARRISRVIDKSVLMRSSLLKQ